VIPLGWLLLVLLASRVLLILRDQPLTRGQALGLALAQCAALLAAAPSPWLLPLLVVIPAANLAGAWLEGRHSSRVGAYRLGVLLVILIAAAFTFAPAHGVTTSPAVIALGDWLGRHFLLPLLPPVPGSSAGPAVMLVVIGALLVLNEANLLIRLILQQIRVVPRGPADSEPDAAAHGGSGVPQLILPPLRPDAPPLRLDQREYNAGRFIGVLERLLVYGFVLQDQYAAIGLILTAKSFARFKEMDERDFAEYVLIGTLLSVSSAVLVGETVKALLP